MRLITVALVALALLTDCEGRQPEHGDIYATCPEAPTQRDLPCATYDERTRTLTVRYSRGAVVPNIHPCEDVGFEELCFVKAADSGGPGVPRYEIYERTPAS